MQVLMKSHELKRKQPRQYAQNNTYVLLAYQSTSVHLPIKLQSLGKEFKKLYFFIIPYKIWLKQFAPVHI